MKWKNNNRSSGGVCCPGSATVLLSTGIDYCCKQEITTAARVHGTAVLLCLTAEQYTAAAV